MWSHPTSRLSKYHTAGIPYVDTYHFPDVNVDAKTQVRDHVNALRNGGAEFGMLWFDIEGTQYWRTCNFNQNFLSQMIDEAEALGVKIGIYASASQWQAIMCNVVSSKFNRYPLWVRDLLRLLSW